MNNPVKAKISYLFSNNGSKEYISYINLMGFEDIDQFNSLLGNLVIFRNKDLSAEIIKNIENALQETLSICKSIIKTEEIKIFLFETKDEFITSKMDGTSGFCTSKNSIILLINLSKFTELALKNSLAHELAHALNNDYDMGNMSLEQGLIFEGVAENFREAMIDKKKSNLVLALNKAESFKLFSQIKPILKSKDIQDYHNLFFYGKKYPLWAGYAIGYHLVKDYLKKQTSLDWSNIVRLNPSVILDKIILN